MSEGFTPEQFMQKLIGFNRLHTQDKVDLFNALQERFGPAVIEVIEQVEGEKARQEWNNIAKQSRSNSLEDLIRLLWEPLRAKGFKFTYEKKDNGYQFQCTRCPIFNLAQEIGATEWLFHHTCNADPFIVAGFNPEIGFKRTKTLMQGDDCCDHFYYIKTYPGYPQSAV